MVFIWRPVRRAALERRLTGRSRPAALLGWSGTGICGSLDKHDPPAHLSSASACPHRREPLLRGVGRCLRPRAGPGRLSGGRDTALFVALGMFIWLENADELRLASRLAGANER